MSAWRGAGELSVLSRTGRAGRISGREPAPLVRSTASRCSAECWWISSFTPVIARRHPRCSCSGAAANARVNSRNCCLACPSPRRWPCSSDSAATHKERCRASSACCVSAVYLRRRMPGWLAACSGRGGGSARRPALRFRLLGGQLSGSWQTGFDAGFDELWQRCAHGARCIGVRDQNFLKWRFGNQPNHQYRVFAVRTRKTAALEAVFRL